MAARKNTSRAQLINHIRKAGVALANGKTVKEVCKGLGISVSRPIRRWRREWGGMNTARAQKLRDLQRENQRQKRKEAAEAIERDEPAGTHDAGAAEREMGHGLDARHSG